MAEQIGSERKAALALVGAVLLDGRMMSEALPKVVDGLPPPAKARAQSLANGCLRWMDRADRLLGRYLKNKPYDHTLNILRLGAYEICQDKQASHGVVNELVAIAKANPETERYAKLINAVLRNVDREGAEIWDGLPPPRLPKKLRKALISDYDRKTVEAFEVAHSKKAPLDITLRSGGVAPDGFDLLPTGSWRAQNAGQVSALSGYSEGQWWVQDAAAALPVRVLDPQVGETILDLCAAPGGKTMQLADSGATVTALDDSAGRMERVKENLARTNLAAELVIEDALEWEGGLFDGVLLDAPCSATGTIRRHPDLPFHRTLEDIDGAVELQRKMLVKAWERVKPGGRLVYCTCSLLKREGEEQAEFVKENLSDVRVEPDRVLKNGVDPSWVSGHGLRTRPDYWSELGGMDGFFIARFEKIAE